MTNSPTDHGSVLPDCALCGHGPVSRVASSWARRCWCAFFSSISELLRSAAAAVQACCSLRSALDDVRKRGTGRHEMWQQHQGGRGGNNTREGEGVGGQQQTRDDPGACVHVTRKSTPRPHPCDVYSCALLTGLAGQTHPSRLSTERRYTVSSAIPDESLSISGGCGRPRTQAI